MRRGLVAWMIFAVLVGGCGAEDRSRRPHHSDAGTGHDAAPGGDAGPDVDGGPADMDGGPTDVDGGPIEMDGGPIDVDGGPAEMDGGPVEMDGGPRMMDAGPTIVDAGPSPSAAIAMVRGAPDGPLDVTVAGATVTYTLPAVGVDPAGFFVQAVRSGPALFVAVDPASLPVAPVAGDVVTFRVTEKLTTGAQPRATAIAGFTILSHGADTAALVQDVSAAADLVSALDSYDSELIQITGTIAADFAGAGAGHSSAQLETGAISGDTMLKLRITDALRTAFDLERGCTLRTRAPLWRFNTQAQPSAWRTTDLSMVSCPVPRVVAAAPTSSTEVVVTFSRDLDPASVFADGRQFTFTGGLAATGAAAAGATVTVSTSPQTARAPYTVTVAATVRDLLAVGIDPAANSAMFTGFGAPVSRVMLNEVDYDQVGTDTTEFIELYNPGSTSVSLATLAVSLVNGADSMEYSRIALSGSLAGGAYLVIADAGTTVPASVTRITIPDSSVQNGGPDGIALIDTATSTLLDALSYEGSITAAIIPGFAAPVSLVEGAAATATDTGAGVQSLARFPNGTDSDDAASDWMLVSPTPGAAN